MTRVDGVSLRIDDVVAVARQNAHVTMAAATRRGMERSRSVVDRLTRGGGVAYGIKTGFGELENVGIPAARVRELQHSLLRSHAIGVGPPLSREQVRAAMLVRANALAKGLSGIRPQIVDLLVELLNRGVHPVVPSKGSLGASGDLAPLAHMALVLIGEGKAEVGGRVITGHLALRQVGLKPLRLESKEGLALVNGTAVMAALACLAVHDARAVWRDAQVAASLSFEALRGSPVPFDPRIVRAKPLPGIAAVAGNLRRLLRGSEVIPSHRGAHKVQDAYTLRCIPQVLGACGEAIAHAARVTETEINSATDNPLVFPDGQVLTGGTFHGQSLAMALDFLALGMCVLTGFAERRIARLIDAHLSGLPPFLTKRSGLNSGMMIAQYTAAALVSESKVLAHPASADSLPASAGQEDWVSMGQTAALKSLQVVENARQAVGLEYLAAAQGLEFLGPLEPGRGPAAAYRSIREAVPPLEEDRVLSEDLASVVRMMSEGRIVAAAERAAGRLADVSLP